MTASVWSHIQHFHIPYLRRFRELGWETHAACAGAPAEAPYCDKTIALPFEKRMLSPANLRAARQLRRLIREERYDLIITHTSLAAFFTRLAVKGLADRPRLVNVMHGYLFDDGTPAVKRGILLTAERMTAGETELLLTMNAWDDGLARRYRLGKRIETIPGMGVDFERLDSARPEDGARLRRELGIPEDAFVLLCAAEFSPRKSQRVLIEAMGHLPENAVLVLAGNGALLDECRTQAAELGDRVRFPGYVPEMPPLYRMADAAVSASRSEGLPFNIMEAMHMGLPVVASAVKGHTDLIEDGRTGFLYPYGDAEACAARIRRLMDDGALRETIGAAAAERAETYEQRRVVQDVMARYLSVMKDDDLN